MGKFENVINLLEQQTDQINSLRDRVVAASPQGAEHADEQIEKFKKEIQDAIEVLKKVD